MAPREATNSFPDQYLTIEYDASVGPVGMPHDHGAGMGGMQNDNGNLDEAPGILGADNNVGNNAENDESASIDDDLALAQDQATDGTVLQPHPPNEVQLPANAITNGTGMGGRRARRRQERGVGVPNGPIEQVHSLERITQIPSIGSDHSHLDVDPLAIDMTDPEEEEAWNIASAMTAASNANCVITTDTDTSDNINDTAPQTPPAVHPIPPNPRNNQNSSPVVRRRSAGRFPLNGGWVTTPGELRSATRPFAVTPSPVAPRIHDANHLRQMFRHRTRNSLTSVLDQDASIDSGTDEEHETSAIGVPELDTTQDTSTSASTIDNDGFSTAPNTPQAHGLTETENAEHNLLLDDTFSYHIDEILPASSSATATATNVTQDSINSIATPMSLSPVRQARSTRRLSSGGLLVVTPPTTVAVIADEDISSSPGPLLPSPPSPHRLRSVSTSVGGASFVSIGSNRSINWTPAFDSSNFDDGSATDTYLNPNLYSNDITTNNNTSITSTSNSNTLSTSTKSNHINLAFGPNTAVSDLKYFAERGCIVPLLRALKTTRLKTLGTRMLADYAKMPHRRVAVASNKRILEFCCRTMLEIPSDDDMGTEWPAREYAVETIRSLTATEDSDGYLMGCSGLLKALAIIARGGPFAVGINELAVKYVGSDVRSGLSISATGSPTRSDSMVSAVSATSGSSGGTLHSAMGYTFMTTINKGLVSGKARLHACIAIMNLSCGKANKLEIASINEILEAMRDVMMAPPEQFSPATSSPPLPNGNTNTTTTPNSVAEEARLKAATCVKNLSNADANDASLLGSPGLIEALGHVAARTCSVEKGATNCTTNACLALMNLSISKANKHRVFKTDGVMDALMTVIVRTLPSVGDERRGNANNEARVKACSALSNLAIGYENKIPMFSYPGFVDAILQVIDTDVGEARTKACSILWSFAAEMKNQVPVVRRGDILPTLVRVAEEDHSTEARFKCVAALTLLAESPENALPLLESCALRPLMDILHDAGADPTQWKGQTASWCVGFLMNMAQSDEAVPFLREAGVVELLAPLLTLDHYQSLKAAMAVTFVCRYDEDDETYDLLRKTENVIPKIISLLHNTLSGRGGNGYKYGVFTLRSSVGCISSLASGPEFMKERIATKPVFESLLRVVTDFCVSGGTKGAIVGGGRDDALSATLAVRALHSLTEYLIPIVGSSALPFGPSMDKKLMTALESLEMCNHPEIIDEMRQLAADANKRIHSSLVLLASERINQDSGSNDSGSSRTMTLRNNIIENSIVASLVQGCCIGPSLHAGDDNDFFLSPTNTLLQQTPRGSQGVNCVEGDESITSSSTRSRNGHQRAVRTFLLTDQRTGRRYAVPTDPSGGRFFNDGHIWCYRRGRFCRGNEVPDPNFRWTSALRAAYSAALATQRSSSASQVSVSSSVGITPTAPNDQQRIASTPQNSANNRGVQSVSPVNSSGMNGKQ